MHSSHHPNDGLRAADPKNSSRHDTSAAGTVFAIMVGALLLAAVMNAGTMLDRAEAGELGPSRDLTLHFWRPIEAVGSAAGLTMPRNGLQAIRELDRTGPSTKYIAGGVGDARAGGNGDLALPPLISSDATTAAPGGQLRHEPAPELEPQPEPEAPPPSASSEPAGPQLSPAGDESDTPTPAVSSTPLGLPGLPPLEEMRRNAEPSFALRRPTVDDPLRILIVGDSTLDAVGTSMQRDLAETGLTSSVLDFRVSSGLSRPDFFDWPAHLSQLEPQLAPEIVVVMVGANDAQAFSVDNQAVEFGTELWFANYRARVAALLEQLTVDGDWVVWIGQPVMRNDEFDAKMRQINQLYVEELGRFPTATFVSSRDATTDEAGQYSAYIVDGNGAPQQIRQNDGIHLTSAGGDRLSPLVIATINEIAPLY